ncbi:MAG: methyltransferase domain-containing protein [Marinobacter sp.]|uniref:spermidine synthase n=1 Tax=Marinobacter sp. TaxID=50741 RepID=UPI00299DD687|nr:methyltransferase domain-containing protein [Marinobacter sp.]MDX1635636.1 methyltransferase domain-containing protein [Marinobacter sp.]
MKLSRKGELIYETRDALGAILVFDQRRHRVLTFDSVFEQSKIDRRKPHLPVHEYNRAMLLPLAWHTPGHATVLGLGAGTLVTALHHLLPRCRIRAVELRQQVVDVAREFFALPESERIQVTVSDARPALRRMEDASTDLILTDLYGADGMSPAPGQARFIDQCERVLSDQGWLAVNYHRLPDVGSSLFEHIRRLFASVLLFRSRTNNFVLYASKQSAAPLAPEASVLRQLQKQLPIDWSGLMAGVRIPEL